MLATRAKNHRVLFILESLPFANDHRVKKQVHSLLEAGYQVSVICRRSAANERHRATPRLRLIEHPPPPQLPGKTGFLVEYCVSWLMAAVLVVVVFVRFGFDAIQACCPPDIYFPLCVPFKAFGRSFVVDQRDLSPEVFADRYGRDVGPVNMALRTLEHLSFRSADHVISVNDSLRQIILDRGGKEPQEVSVVGNGPLLAALPSVTPQPQDPSAPLVCCWVGVMGPQDHVDMVLQLARELTQRRQRQDCRFVLVGAGESLDELRKLSSDMGLGDWVTFTGWLEQDDLTEILSNVAIGLDTNLQEEVTPVKGMEYMAFRIPMVAFDLRETRLMAGEAASYATPGDVLELADRVAELLDDADSRRRMGAVGRRRVEEKLCWELQQRPYLAVFERLLRRGESGADPIP